MKNILFVFLLLISFIDAFSQCDFIIPPVVKKINYCKREISFSDVTINGSKTTYLAVEKGQKIVISTYFQAKKNGDYCPGCIVQIYWGIRGYTSTCGHSFYGYRFGKRKTKHSFKAPTEDGIYYITMGGTLDYSCKNNKNRPWCPASAAFAVLKVGDPDPETEITLTKVNNNSEPFLKTELLKSGCFGPLNKIEWFFNSKKLEFDNQQEVPLTQSGSYKVKWSNCQGTADSLSYLFKNEKVIVSPVEIPTVDTTKIEYQVKNKDKFILKNLTFDLGKSEIKKEAEHDLDQLIEIMKKEPSMRILLEGHTDAIGNFHLNLLLSRERVKSTKAYLVKKGINENRIETKGWGHQKPLIRTKDVEKGKVNRRVEIQILKR